MDYLSLLEKIKLYRKKYHVKTLGKTKFNREIFAVELNHGDDFATAILDVKNNVHYCKICGNILLLMYFNNCNNINTNIYDNVIITKNDFL